MLRNEVDVKYIQFLKVIDGLIGLLKSLVIFYEF